jgi:hypothetical protein
LGDPELVAAGLYRQAEYALEGERGGHTGQPFGLGRVCL